ncbi:Appr-1-p processing domain-containing protein [Tolypothrix tenuis PCC 7101]|uniref:Appr-1-p processing domain-containing protein n=1 Tax=Tolypothrix tenuis PCC 7101 TaxID=231146 RepID=A0A1Z4N3X3_9CYAN|nr:macro domain-containing protein [Aulosira sp. FACHB-113]BAZ00443.1 Appr-1-p processing domain-containing protein [Tolypothrix tenuis PCC 7101]BAZ75635.1 Appr-1-p processing domain-containing protein [Aulosira laxa NIES-50]
MKLVLVAPNSLLAAAFQEHFNYLPNVEIVNDYFEWLPNFDCLVSPANSFGMMDGGMDAAIIKFFGSSLMDRVQQRILADYLGEQPVGTSMIVETGHFKHPFLAHTPTMRVPMSIMGTDIPYISMWAMLLAVRHHNQHAQYKINTIACPGLGTGIGRVPYHEAARLMALAYDHFLYPPKHLNCFVAASRQLLIWEGRS